MKMPHIDFFCFEKIFSLDPLYQPLDIKDIKFLSVWYNAYYTYTICKMKFIIFAVVLFAKNGLFSDEKDGAYFPQWQDLECQVSLSFSMNIFNHTQGI